MPIRLVMCSHYKEQLWFVIIFIPILLRPAKKDNYLSNLNCSECLSLSGGCSFLVRLVSITLDCNADRSWRFKCLVRTIPLYRTAMCNASISYWSWIVSAGCAFIYLTRLMKTLCVCGYVYTHILLLPLLSLQPTVGFSLLSNFLPFHPFLT